MNESPPANRLIVTTETVRGLGERVFVLLIFGALPAIVTLLVYVDRKEPIGDRAVLSAAFLQIALFGPGVYCVFCSPRGTWVLDDDEIAFQPCLRRRRTIAWQSVDRVIWRRDWVVLKAGRVTIPLDWRMLKGSELVSARAWIEAKLSPAFDLKEITRAQDAESLQKRNVLERVLHFLKLVRLALLLSLPWMTFLVAAFFAPAGGVLWFWSAAAYLGSVTICGLLAYGFVVVARDERVLRRVHPEWPWRLRRAETFERTKADHDPWLESV